VENKNIEQLEERTNMSYVRHVQGDYGKVVIIFEKREFEILLNNNGAKRLASSIPLAPGRGRNE
jgi:hypothetical protein